MFATLFVTRQSLLYMWSSGTVYANHNSCLIFSSNGPAWNKCHATNEQKYSLHSDTCQPNNVCPQAKTSFLLVVMPISHRFYWDLRDEFIFYAKCLKCDAPDWHYIVLYLPPCSSFFNKCKYLWRRWLFFMTAKIFYTFSTFGTCMLL